MFLTQREEGALAGEQGSARGWGMEVLLHQGERCGSPGLVPVTKVHLAGPGSRELPSPDDLEWSPTLEFIRPSINPTKACHDSEGEKGTVGSARAGSCLNDWCQAFRVNHSHSCTPYLVGQVPGPGEVVVSGSASVSCYFNSVLGSWSVRASAKEALASALVGLTPENPIQQAQERAPTVEIVLKGSIMLEPASLGAMVRELVGRRVPLLDGVRPDLSGMKGLAASLSVDDGPDIFHLSNSTVDRTRIGERIVLEENDYARWIENQPGPKGPDAVVLGCPHLSEKELIRVARAMDGARPSQIMPVFFLTSQLAWDKSPRPALVLPRFGTVCCDACPLIGLPAHLRSIVTNGPKLCHCLGGTDRAVSYAPLDDILDLIRSG